MERLKRRVTIVGDKRTEVDLLTNYVVLVILLRAAMTMRTLPGIPGDQLSAASSRSSSDVTLTSIANLLVKNRQSMEVGPCQLEKEVSIDEASSEKSEREVDEASKQKRSTELAAVANTCALKKDYEASVHFYTKAVKLNSTDFRFFCNRSYCYEKLRQYDKALEDAQAAIELNPHRVKPLFRKGKALVGLRQYEEAEEVFKQVLKKDPDCEATKSELLQLRYIALRDIGFDIDAALLAAKRTSSITDAIDFVVNVELLTLKSTDATSGSQTDGEKAASGPVSNNAHIPLDTGPDKVHEKAHETINIPNGVIPHVNQKSNSDDSSSSSRAAAHRKALKFKPTPPQIKDSCSSSIKSTSPDDMFSIGSVHGTFRHKSDNGISPLANVTNTPTNLFAYRGLWVGNISPKCTVATLRNLFSRYGQVLSVRVLTDKFCAFLSFDNPDSPVAAIADLYNSCVEDVSNEWRPLKFRFIPTADQPDLNYARPVQPRNNNNECYFWRTTGCNSGDRCKLLHIPICKGIDYQPWMKK